MRALKNIEALAQASSWIVIGISTAVLFGWILQQPLLIQFGTGRAMAPNAAISLLAAGAALRLILLPSPMRMRAARVLALIPLMLGGLTLIEFIGGISLGIDQLFLADPLGLVQTGFTARMAPLAALVLAIAGSAILVVDHEIDHRYDLSMWLTVSLFVLSLSALFGLGYDAKRLQVISGTSGIALHTVFTMLVLTIGLLCARTQRGPAAIFSAAGDGGLLARRALPVAFLAPVMTGWLLLEGIKHGLYGLEGFAALTATLTFLLFAGLTWQLARVIEQRAEIKRAADAQDQHNRELLNQAHQRLRRFVDANIIGVVMVGSDGSIVEANDYYLHLIGYSRADFEQGKVDWRTLTPAEWLETDDKAIRDLRENGACKPYEKEYLRRDGSRVWVYLVYALLPGSPEQIAAFVLDITDRKAAEQVLRDLNENLEKRVLERTASIEAAKKDLESFSYSVSHDLRAPLRAIDSFSNILLEDYSGKLDAEGQRLLQTVRRNTDKMARLIDDILAFSRAGRRDLERTTVNMGDLVQDVLSELIPAEGEHKIELHIGDLPDMQADKPMLRQALVNLLSNAIKFSARREPAVIDVSGNTTLNETTISIRDNGAGFDPAYAHKLFGVFQRLHGADEFSGTGIGLAIVKRIIDKHGGRVWAEGAVDHGATFHFSLPIKATEAESGAST